VEATATSLPAFKYTPHLLQTNRTVRNRSHFKTHKFTQQNENKQNTCLLARATEDPTALTTDMQGTSRSSASCSARITSLVSPD
jgi:hypothetical protein